MEIANYKTNTGEDDETADILINSGSTIVGTTVDFSHTAASGTFHKINQVHTMQLGRFVDLNVNILKVAPIETVSIKGTPVQFCNCAVADDTGHIRYNFTNV